MESERPTKRRTVPEDVEASLGEVTNRLGAITSNDHDSLIALVVDVTGVDTGTAAFYLEASQWNPHAAVQYYMEQGTPQQRHAAKRTRRARRA